MNLVRFLFTLFLLFFLPPLVSANALADEKAGQSAEKIRIVFEGGEAIVNMLDNPLARDFLERLPLNIVFKDFSQTEKIFYLQPRLNIVGGVNADKIRADFCYFEPWGNIAVFYKGFGQGASLYSLGLLESGKADLARKNGEFAARIEKMAK